ncbi:unnamed protein product [Caenorhabditis nigoni]
MLPDPAPATIYPMMMNPENYAPDAPVPQPERQVTPDRIVPSEPPSRPVKRLNGKQMIRMDEEPKEGPLPYSLPNKRKNYFPKKSKNVGNNLHVNYVIFCRACRDNISIDSNRKMTAQLCGRCKICTC